MGLLGPLFDDTIGSLPLIGDVAGQVTGATEEKAIETAGREKKAALEAARIRQNQVAAQQYANRMHSLDRVMAMYAPLFQTYSSFHGADPNRFANMPGGANYTPAAQGLPAQQPLSALDLYSDKSPAAVNAANANKRTPVPFSWAPWGAVK